MPAPTFVIRRVGIYGKFRWLLFGTIFPPFLLLCVLLFCARIAAAIMLSLARDDVAVTLTTCRYSFGLSPLL